MSHFLKTGSFGPLTKNSHYNDFLGVLVLLSTEISRLGTDIYILDINHLLKLGKSFLTVNKQILQLTLFLRFKILNFGPKIRKVT